MIGLQTRKLILLSDTLFNVLRLCSAKQYACVEGKTLAQ